MLYFVQGETLEQQFGEKEVCFRTLDLYTSAVLESSLNPSPQPKAEFRTVLDEMAQACLPLCFASLQSLPCALAPEELLIKACISGFEPPWPGPWGRSQPTIEGRKVHFHGKGLHAMDHGPAFPERTCDLILKENVIYESQDMSA